MSKKIHVCVEREPYIITRPETHFEAMYMRGYDSRILSRAKQIFGDGRWTYDFCGDMKIIDGKFGINCADLIKLVVTSQ